MSRQQRTADSLLAPLDKSQIPTHILYDRVAPMALLDGFNLHYNNPDTSDVHHFLHAYYELHQADYNNPGTAPCRQVLADNARHYRQHDTLLLGALRYRFNYLDSNAVRNGQLRWDTSAPSRLFDVAGRSGSPYLLREVAVAAALADSARSGTVSFRLDPASVFTNVGAALVSASIDFGDGSGARALLPGQVVQIGYSTSGRKTLRYVLSYADGSQFTTYSVLYVPKITACTNCRTTAAEPTKACRVEPLTATIPFQGIAGQAEVSYYYSSAKLCDKDNNVAQPITKPIIIVDGIDYDGTRKGANIFGEYLFYRNNGRDQNLGVELQDAGYDIVILDFPNIEQKINIGPFVYNTIANHSGADYMERNAYTLVTLIQQLNQKLAVAGSTEKIVVIGPSMGGQIARYALAYMEHNNLPHNTRLFLSLDSPHNGATIPIGLQHFVDYFAAQSKESQLVAGLAELDSPAARELTQHHHSQGTAFLPDPSRTSFLSSLNGLGSYPSQLRRVAVANGAIDGTPQSDQNGQTLQPLQQMFVFEQRGKPGGGYVNWTLGLLSRLITNASARVYYEPGFGQTHQVLAAYYAFQGRHSQEATGPASSCGLDSSPGGYRKFVTFAQSSGGLTQERNWYSVRDRACFIPTTSALGYTQPADNCQPAGFDLVCSGTTSFDAYYGPTGHNEEHIQLTPGNVEFIRNEILLKTPTPVFLVAPTEICANGAVATFSVQGECVLSRVGQPQPGTTYTWTPGPGLQVASGQGTATVQVRSLMSTTTNSYLEVVAVRAGYAASPAVRVTVRQGNSSVYVSGPTGPTCFSEDFTYSFSSTLTQGIPQWHVYLDNAPRDGFITSNEGANIVVQPVDAGTMRVTATVTDQCTGQPVTASATTILVEYTRGTYGLEPCPIRQGRYASAASAYPNPADEQLILTGRPTSTGDTAYTATIYNAQGKAVRQLTGTGATKVNTASLPSGLYYVIIEQGRVLTRVQVRVSH